MSASGLALVRLGNEQNGWHFADEFPDTVYV